MGKGLCRAPQPLSREAQVVGGLPVAWNGRVCERVITLDLFFVAWNRLVVSRVGAGVVQGLVVGVVQGLVVVRGQGSSHQCGCAPA